MFIRWLILIKLLLIFQDKFKMRHTFKTISFTLLILSLGLVLSACGNKTTEEQNNQETEELMNEGTEELMNEGTEELMNEGTEEPKDEGTEEIDVSKWREYENEYFNLKFKYHNNWYFQRDNLNQGDYIAVYGFSPSAEELQNKEYRIKLFILNSEDNFTEDFTYSKEKESDDKKYILVSNNNEYQEILNMMFENLEIVSNEEVNLNTYINEEYGFSLEFPQTWNKYNVKKSDNSIYFGIPIQDSLFVINAISKDVWERMQSEEGPKPTYLNENDEYIFGYSRGQDYVEAAIPRSKEVPAILSTFKFIN